MNSLPYNIPDNRLPTDTFAINAYTSKWKSAASINNTSIYWNATAKISDAQYATLKSKIAADLAAVENQINTLQPQVHKALNNTSKEIDFVTSNSTKIGNTLYKTSTGKSLKDLMIDWKNVKQAINSIQYELRFNLKPGYTLLV